MTVADLIEILKTFPQDAPVACFNGGRDGDYEMPTPELVEGTVWEWGWEPGTRRHNDNRKFGVKLS